MFKAIEMPTNCPSCNSILIFKSPQLFCKNSNCDEKTQKKLEYFITTIKIKGLGPKSLEKLKITSIKELYELSEEDIIDLLSSEKLGIKAYQEIQDSLSSTLQELLPAFSIPLVGKTAAEKLCVVIRSLDDLTAEKCKLAGLGPKVTHNLLGWFQEQSWQQLPFNFKSSETLRVTNIKGTVCITGKLFTYKTKNTAKKILIEHGYVVKDSVTKDVTHLINESGIESTKVIKARSYGITILTNINDLIGEQ